MPQRQNTSLPQESKAQNSLALLLAMHELRDALRQINDRVHAGNRQPTDETLLSALAEANRA